MDEEEVDDLPYDAFLDEQHEIAVMCMIQAAAVLAEASGRRQKKIDHRLLPRARRSNWRHNEALHCIQRDYLGIPADPSTPLFDFDGFIMMFRVSKARFQRFMEDIGSSPAEISNFYLSTITAAGEQGASFEARLLLPLKSLAYGVPSHTFTDYFQMSKTLADKCCKNFVIVIKFLYEKEYLRIPTREDMKSITNLHRSVHKVDGMFGSIDCMHVYWKNCPKAWEAQYQSGDKGHPTIVLEAACDHHLWFWHASFGYAGTLGDKTILTLSPLMQALLDGTFNNLEQDCVPYNIGTERFDQLYMLGDGAYPRYTRFVKSIKQPITPQERVFSEWQESARKDIERAFGVLQCRFQWLQRPVHTMDLQTISNRVACCLILHNICVSDRVMDQQVRAWYKPDNHVDLGDEQIRQSQEHLSNEPPTSVIGAANMVHNMTGNIALNFVKEQWNKIGNLEQHARLHTALINLLFMNRNS